MPGVSFITSSGAYANKVGLGISSIVGPTGPQGFQGFIGPTGPQGFQGFIGPTGTSSFWNSTGSNIYYNSGSVAIGKISPAATLDIQGSIQMSGGNFNMFGSQLQNPIFNGYRETIFVANYSGAFTINASTGNNFSVQLNSGSNLVSFTNFAATGTLHGINLFVSQDAQGNRTLSYPSTVSFGAAGVPVLSTSANLTDVLNFITFTSGSKILGLVGGKGF